MSKIAHTGRNLRIPITMDVDGTALMMPYLPSEKWVYDEYKKACKGMFRDLPYYTYMYKVYFLTARNFNGAHALTAEQLEGTDYAGIITGIENCDKEAVSKSLGAIAHIDDNFKVRRSNHTLLLESPWWKESKEYANFKCPRRYLFHSIADSRLVNELYERARNFNASAFSTHVTNSQ